MSVFSTMFGAAWGFGIVCCANGIRKLPTLNRPWDHLLWMCGMGYVGSVYPSWEKGCLDRINLLRAERGMEPFQHTPWGFDIKLLKKDS
mmetsp:Transcript_9915/g.32351  ORF Transcript_9915/g.32351 Transcript_9915/m.32351 type:complete len:89 (-) Transcript_9915:1240-1506(-)